MSKQGAWCFVSLNPKGGDSDQSYHFDILFWICFWVQQLGQVIVKHTHTHQIITQVASQTTRSSVLTDLTIPRGFPLRQKRGDKNYITARHSSCLHSVIIPFVQQNLALTDVEHLGIFFYQRSKRIRCT